MASQAEGHAARQAKFEGPDEGRGWLQHGLAALAISALGLAVAGSVALTTNAQTTQSTSQLADTANVQVATPVTQADPLGEPVKDKPKGNLAAFSQREAAAEDASRSAEFRTAVINERAAQRDEGLSKTAEDVTRSSQDAAADKRDKKLAETDKSTYETAVKLAQDKLRRAVAARVAAEQKRQTAQTSTTGSDSTVTAGPDGSSSNANNGSAGDAGNATEPDASPVSSGGRASSPVPGAVIGSHFGQTGHWSRYHTGLDFRAGQGTPIKAVKSGVVTFAGNKGHWAGNYVAIRHGDGKSTLSAHMSAMAVRTGQTVQAGQVIGYVGQTGRAFGAHLHFELYPAGVEPGKVYSAINPVPWLRASGVNAR